VGGVDARGRAFVLKDLLHQHRVRNQDNRDGSVGI
jgi:hypothetical protein